MKKNMIKQEKIKISKDKLNEFSCTISGLDNASQLKNIISRNPYEINKYLEYDVGSNNLKKICKHLPDEILEKILRFIIENAICCGHLDVLTYLQNNKSSLVNWSINNNQYLIKAILHGQVEVVDFLLKHQSIRNIIKIGHCRGVSFAALTGQVGIQKKLQEVDTEFKSVGIRSYEPIRYALKNLNRLSLSEIIKSDKVKENLKNSYCKNIFESVIGKDERGLSKFWLCMFLWKNPEELRQDLHRRNLDSKQFLTNIREGALLSRHMRIIHNRFTKWLNRDTVSCIYSYIPDDDISKVAKFNR